MRAKGLLTAAEKESLKDLKQEHHLYLNADGRYELHPVEMLPSPPQAPDVRAFLFERGGKRVVAYWHMRGAGMLRVDLDDGSRTLPVDRLRYLETPLTCAALKDAWLRAK